MKTIGRTVGKVIGVKKPPTTTTVTQPIGKPAAIAPTATAAPVDTLDSTGTPNQKANIRARQRRPSLVYGSDTGVSSSGDKRVVLG